MEFTPAPGSVETLMDFWLDGSILSTNYTAMQAADNIHI